MSVHCCARMCTRAGLFGLSAVVIVLVSPLVFCQDQQEASKAAAPLPDFATGSLLYENFSQGWKDRWLHSGDEKYTGRFQSLKPEFWKHKAIKVTEKNHHYGISTLLSEPVDISTPKGLVVQYTVKFADGINCGGAYVKLLTYSEGFQPTQLKDDTPYSIMFGPDKCGTPGKVHLILRHKNPRNGTVSEHHLQEVTKPAVDTRTHLYTLQIKPDNKFEIWLDGESVSKGSLLDKLDPPLVPSKAVADPTDIKPADWVDNDEIPDPKAVKPADWDDRKMVPDMDAVKPAGWLEDEPAMIDDPSAARPAEWDDDEDGAWVVPKVANPKCKKAGCGAWTRPNKPNPKYKGPWSAPKVPNPDYKGPWVQRTIPNPDHYEDSAPLQNVGRIGGLAVEIWTIDAGYTFGGFLVTQDLRVAERYRDKMFRPVQAAEAKAAKAKVSVEEAEREARVKKVKTESSIWNRVASRLLIAMEHPSLTSIRPLMSPFKSALETSPLIMLSLLSFALFMTIVSVTIVLCNSRRTPAPPVRRRGPRDAVGRAKKEDVTGSDDEDEDDDGEIRPPAPEDEEEEGGQEHHKEEEEEEEEEHKEAAAGAAAEEEEEVDDAPPARCPFFHGGAAAAKQEEEEEEEEEEEKAPKPRKRVPRAD